MRTAVPGRRRLLLAVPACLALLAGCGRRGRLRLPESAAAQAPPAAQPREDE